MDTDKLIKATVYVPGGVFDMGSSDSEIDRTVKEWSGRLLLEEYEPHFVEWLHKEAPPHEVRIAPFFMMKYPVTNGSYLDYLKASGVAATPESISECLPNDHPVWGVNFDMANGYIKWLSSNTNLNWRLPSEEEWEWAARGGLDYRYPFGDEFDASLCNTLESCRGTTTPVYAHQNGDSKFGIADLAGNVEEWTSSTYQPYPGGREIIDDLLRLLGPNYPILRGGSFELNGDLARTRRRHGPHPGSRFRVTGFRCVLSDR